VTGVGEEKWLDRDAGPVVRPYAITRGRTRPALPDIGLIDTVAATGTGEGQALPPEHRRLLELCRRPAALADVASEVDLPLGVVRVLIGDLCELGLVRVVPVAEQQPASQESVLRKVLEGLKAL
jgi:hypothetical protein